MYIESIYIKEFRILKDLQIKFQPPENGKNVINVIAGVNGCGKTTLLEAFFQYFKTSYLSDYVQIKLTDIPPNAITWNQIYTFYSELNSKNKNKVGIFEDPRLIFIPANLNFQYQPTPQLNTNYQFLNLIDKDILGKTESYIREYILSIERESHIANPEKRTRLAISKFNKPFIKTKLLTKLHDLDKNRFNRPVFQNIKGDLVTIDELSDGEKQLYGRVVALMMLEPRNSIILIDEPEISLHPAWQQEIMKIYANIGKNNQFIIATHSPQIIANTPYKNLILLTQQNNRIIPVYPQHPPSGVDINSILTEIMGADNHPKELDELYQQYRIFVENAEETTQEAQKIKDQILELESANSVFMQEMDFLIALRAES